MTLASTSSPVVAVGRVSAPPGLEADNTRFYAWIADAELVEATQLVHVRVPVPAAVQARLELQTGEVVLHAVVDQVQRQSSSQGIQHDRLRHNGDIATAPPIPGRGVSYARCRIIAQAPPLFIAAREDALLYLSGQQEVAAAYGYERMQAGGLDYRFPVGLVKNGGGQPAGPACLDLRYILGENAGHVSVTGVAGLAAKSSYLLVLVRALLDRARVPDGDPTHPPFIIRPIVFNVKGEDLMFIDLPNRDFDSAHQRTWQAMGLRAPAGPFVEATFFAPSLARTRTISVVTRPIADAARQCRPYYWTLSDVIRLGLWRYLFSDESQEMEAMMALAAHVQSLITEDCAVSDEHPLGVRLRRGQNQPGSFRELADFLRAALRDRTHVVRDGGVHSFASLRALSSRLSGLFTEEGATIFDADGQGAGQPLIVTGNVTIDPIVIDVHTLPRELMRFVVGAVVDQVKRSRVGPQAVPGLKYLLVLDEMNWFAPHDARDEVSRLLVHVAAQLRSQGILLFGGQQHASQVAPEIFQNSDLKILGRCGTVELNTPTWSSLLSSAEKQRAMQLGPDEKMVIQGPFFGWMNVLAPYPPWAMKREQAAVTTEAPRAFRGEE